MSGSSKMAALREAAARMNAEHDPDHDAYDPLDPDAGPPPPPQARAREDAQAAPTTVATPLVEQNAVQEAPAMAALAPTGKARKASANEHRVHTSIYLPRDLRRRLREIAAAEECKVHDLIIEGLQEVVARRCERKNSSV